VTNGRIIFASEVEYTVNGSMAGPRIGRIKGFRRGSPVGPQDFQSTNKTTLEIPNCLVEEFKDRLGEVQREGYNHIPQFGRQLGKQLFPGSKALRRAAGFFIEQIG
jgi:hypothetical protein